MMVSVGIVITVQLVIIPLVGLQWDVKGKDGR
jgi:hypothetical protein